MKSGNEVAHNNRVESDKKNGTFFFSVDQACWSGVGKGELYPSSVLGLPDRAALRLEGDPQAAWPVEAAKEKVECPIFWSPIGARASGVR